MAIDIGDAVLKVGVDTKDMQKGLKGLGNQIKQHQKAIGIGMVAMGGAILAAGALSIKTFAEMGDEVQKMALRTGFSTEALSELRHAAEISGTSLTSVEKAVKRMSGTILDAQDGLETYIRAFQHIGIEVAELDGLDPEGQFLRIAEAIAEVEDPTKRAAIAQDIFGRAGTELLPLFAQGKEGLAELREEAHRLGIVFDQEAANKAAELTDALHKTEEAMSGMKMKIAEQLIPILIPLIDKVTALISGFTEWAKAHPALTKTIVISTAAFGALLFALGGLLLIMPGLTAATGAFGITLSAAIWPVTLVVAAVAALIAIGILLWKNWDEISNFFMDTWSAMKIAVLENVRKMLGALKTFMGWIPGFGDKIREAHDAIANMIEEEKQVKTIRRVKHEMEDLKEGIEEVTDEIVMPGGLVPALEQEEVALSSASDAVQRQIDAIDGLGDSYSRTGEIIGTVAAQQGVGVDGGPPTTVSGELAFAKQLSDWEAGRAGRVQASYAKFQTGGGSIADVLGAATLGMGYGRETLGAFGRANTIQELGREIQKRAGLAGPQAAVVERKYWDDFSQQIGRFLGPDFNLRQGREAVNITVELDGATIAKVVAAPLVDEIRVTQGLRL